MAAWLVEVKEGAYQGRLGIAHGRPDIAEDALSVWFDHRRNYIVARSSVRVIALTEHLRELLALEECEK